MQTQTQIQKKNKYILITLMLCSSILFTACSNKPKGPASEINGYPSSKNNGISPMRMTALQQVATATGAQSGLSWESQRINQFLARDEYVLEKSFNFRGLILDNNVLPPVLAEGRNALNLDNPETIRLADQIYKIESPPRFVTAPPTWRDYLWMYYEKPDKPNISLLPRDNEERKIWNEAVLQGWEDGIKQANQIFSANMGRMKRDYNGMVLYRVLLAQKMVTAPHVTHKEMGITGNAKELRINDQVLRITATSKLVPNSKEWKAIATPGVEGAWRTQGIQGTKTLE